PATTAEDPVPADFTLAVTVLPAPAPAPQPGPEPSRARLPARYVIEADWALRASFGAGAREETFPPLARQLTEGQVEELWKLTEATGLAQPGAAKTPGHALWNPAILIRDPDEVAGIVAPSPKYQYIVTITANGRHSAIAIEIATNEGGDPSVAALVDRLAELSW